MRRRRVILSGENASEGNGVGERRRRMISDVASNLLEHPTDIIEDQPEVRVVCGGGKCICPPYEAEDYKKYPIGATAVEVIKRKFLGELLIGWQPCFAGGGLDSNPPLEELRTKLLGVDIVTACEIAAIFHEHGDLCGPVG